MIDTLRIVFAGTPEFAVPSLAAALASKHTVVGVWTQPDRPAGRGRQLTASPVKQVAMRHELPVFQPATLKTSEAQAELAALDPDLMIVVAYGLILPKAVLAIPRFGCWNVHASLLPRWRGAAPIQRAIEAGDAETGVCLMQMEAGLDTGPVLLKLPTAIAEGETGGSLHDRLAQLGAQVLKDGLTLRSLGIRPIPEPQPEEGVTYAHKLEKAEALLDASLPAIALERKVRAFDPWPVAEIDLAGERVRVHAVTAIASGSAQHEPGSVIGASREGIDVATGDGILRITRLQRAGGRTIDAIDYLNARPALRGG
jgi:methionyl-tRNA formyltransferase